MIVKNKNVIQKFLGVTSGRLNDNIVRLRKRIEEKVFRSSLTAYGGWSGAVALQSGREVFLYAAIQTYSYFLQTVTCRVAGLAPCVRITS